MSVITDYITVVGEGTIRPILSLGRFLTFAYDGMKRIFFPPVSLTLFISQLEFVGNRSFGIIAMAAVMVGAIFGFQLGEIFRIFGAESLIGAAAGFTLSKELAPVIGAMLVTGRAGSAMAAEIATMRVNEQIDAMRVMAVNPVGYLVAPRIAATMIMMPLLTVIFIIMGVASAFYIGVAFYDVDVGIFFEKIRWIVSISDIMDGLEKSVVFGLIIGTVGCFQGFYAAGGAKGVGEATTASVVVSMLAIIIADFFISYLQFQLA